MSPKEARQVKQLQKMLPQLQKELERCDNGKDDIRYVQAWNLIEKVKKQLKKYEVEK